MSTCFHIEEGALIFKRRYETVRIEGWGEHGLRVRSTENHTFTQENWALSENVPHTASVWTEDRMTRWNYTQHIAVIENGDIRAVFYFAVEEDPTYGYIDGAWMNDSPYGVIHRIAVGQSGRGAAAECFQFAYERCGNLRIDTHEKNIPMQRCLAKNGFRRCGIIYLEDGDPRIAYQKE